MLISRIVFSILALVIGIPVTAQQPVSPGAAVPGPARASVPSQARDVQPARTGTGSISGRVLSTDGRPLRRVHVRASGAALPAGRVATTDVDGRFQLGQLPAGTYVVVANKAGYVPPQYGPVAGSRTPIELGEGEKVDKADIVLARGCILTGHVSDEFGEPMVDVYVTALRNRSVGGRTRPMQVGGRTTDDTGYFRIFGLAPGPYYLSATARVTSYGPLSEADPDRSGYAPSYYPGTASVSEAQVASCRAEEEVGGFDFSLVPVRTSRITGRVIDSLGNPVAGGIVSLGSMLTGGGGAAGSGVRPDGTFLIAGVGPGDYYLMARSGFGGPAGSDREFVRIQLSVSGSDISGLVLQTTKGGRIRGQVVPDAGLSFDFPLEKVTVGTRSATLDPLPMPPGNAKVLPDGTFEISNLFGALLVRGGGGPGGWVLKEVRLNGRDITDAPLDFSGTEVVSDVEVVLTNKASIVSGTVTDDRRSPVEAMVLVFSSDPARWEYPSRFIGVSRTGPKSEFKIQTLPPGDYLAVAVPIPHSPMEVDYQDPEYLERLRPLATSLVLREGETRTIELKLSQDR